MNTDLVTVLVWPFELGSLITATLAMLYLIRRFRPAARRQLELAVLTLALCAYLFRQLSGLGLISSLVTLLSGAVFYLLGLMIMEQPEN